MAGSKKETKKQKKKQLAPKEQQAETIYSPEEKKPEPEPRVKTTAKKQRIVVDNAGETTFESISLKQKLAGRYRLLREIARGGMGVVFEGRDEKLDNLPVAIKVLPDELARNEAAIIRLKKEALAAIKLTHRNIVRLHAFEQDGDSTFLVMELLDGPNLEVELAHREKLPVEEVVDIAKQVSSALTEAHKQNIVHRDIKPANLMFTGKEDNKVLKVTDFGIAFELKESMTRVTSMTAMTPLYASPEQMRAEQITAKSDQYSLAVTLYELLSGRPPFSGAGLEHQITTATPRALTNVPQQVNAAIQKALHKDPEKRFKDCDEFVSALEGNISVKTSGGNGKWYFLLVLFILYLIGTYSDPVTPTPEPTTKPTQQVSVTKAPTPKPSKKPPTVTPSVAAASGTIFVSSRPEGASIYLNGEDTGLKTNNLVRNVPVGEQQIELRHQLYYPTKQAVSVTKDKVAKPAEIELKPAWGHLVLSGKPANLKYRLRPLASSVSMRKQEYKLGQTVKKLPNGKYLIEAYAPLYERKTETIEIPGEEKTLNHTLSLERLTAPLTIKSSPAVATITIDGTLMSKKTPATFAKISCEDHHIELEKGDLFWQGKRFVREDGTEINVTLKTTPGQLLFTSTPVGAKVYCKGLPPDKKYFGKTTVAGLKHSLGPGPYTFKAILKDYKAKEMPGTVTAKKETKIHFDLQKQLGWLVIEASGKPKTLELNGKGIPLSQLGKKLRLTPGLHVITATMPYHHPTKVKINVVDGKTAKAHLYFKQIVGYLDLTVVPSNAVVHFDGQFIPSIALKDIFRQPGRYRLQVKCPGYLDNDQYITIRDGQRLKRTVSLSKITATPGESFTNSIGMKMIWVPAGSFSEKLHPPDGATKHIILTSGFWIGKYEVTQAEWNKIMPSNPSKENGSRLPVNCVTWNTAREFCHKLSSREAAKYKLPTVAQWAYAARCGGSYPRLYGSINDIGWHAKNAGDRLHAVGQKKPNAWGMYDVLGNVCEWTDDILQDIKGNSLTDPYGKAPYGQGSVRSTMGAAIGYVPSAFEELFVSVGIKNEVGRSNGFRVIRMP